MFVHIVQPGDTLSSISRRYGYPVAQLRSVNGLEETNIVTRSSLTYSSICIHSATW